MKARLWILLILFLSREKSFSQLNEGDTVKIQLRAGLSGNYQQGNVNIHTLRSRFEVSVRLLNNLVFKSQNNSLYQSVAAKKADNDIASRNFLYYKPQHPLYPFGITYISSNFRRKVKHRYFAGAGITGHLLHKPNHDFKLSGSIVYESSGFNGQTFNYSVYNGKDKINTWRGTIYMAGWDVLFNRRFKLYYDAYWQPAWSDRHNYRTQLDVGADLPVWKGLTFSLLYLYTREGVVISGIKTADKILTVGFSYNFKSK